MRFSRSLFTLAAVGVAACGPTYVVQAPPTQRVPVPPRVEPLQVNIVRPDEGRVLIQTSRAAYVAVFELVPGRGVSLVYPAPYRARDVMLTGLTWVDVNWTMRYDYTRRYPASDTRYIYAVASDTPLRIADEDYDHRYLARELGSEYWSENPNATARAISRDFVRSQPDEWWGEDLQSMALVSPRVTVAIRLARVYCPGGTYFEVRDDYVDRVWCPSRTVRGAGRPVAAAPDSVISSNGRRVGRTMNPAARTPVFRIPTATEIQQQGHANQPPPNQPPTTQPPQVQPPQNQPPQTQPPPNQPPQNPPQDPKDHDDNGRRAHGDPRNSDPRGNGVGFGNGGRTQPATLPPSNPQPPQTPAQQPPSQPGNSSAHGNNGNPNSGNAAATTKPETKPEPNEAPKTGIGALMRGRGPQAAKKDDKKSANDSTEKKKP